MIAIIGATHDDILYFSKVLYNAREETILNKFTAHIGTIFNQEVIVIHEQFSSILTSAVITEITSKYYIDLVISVGKCVGVDYNTKSGDIVISNKIIDVNVDLALVRNVGLGEIPGFQREFLVQNDIIHYMKNSVSKRTYVNGYDAVYFSSDNLSEDNLLTLSSNRFLFGITDERIVVDHNSAGMALAASLKNVPFISIKVVENMIDQQAKIENYLDVLERYIDLGKSVVSTIGDIGRNDILRGGN